MKDQDKNLQEQLNEEEIGNLSEKEFIAMIVKMIQNLRKRMEAQTKKIKEMFDKEIEDLKNKQTEMNNTITEMKNKLEEINNRITEAEERISELEDRVVEITATVEQNKEKRMKRNEDCLRDLWDNIKHFNICIIGLPEEEKEKGLRKYLKRYFSNMGKEIVTQVQEV